jgi:nitrous oxidase accessory protein NosD
MTVTVHHVRGASVSVLEDDKTITVPRERVSVVTVGTQGPQGVGFGAIAAGNAIVGGTGDAAVEVPDQFNVVAFGAVGDGTTDDTAAIQAAVNALPATGGIVVAPRGSYKLTGTVTISGKADVVLDFGEATITQTAALTPVLTLNNMVRTKVVGGNLIGLGTDYLNTSAVYGAAAMKLGGACEDVSILDCSMTNFAGAGVWVVLGDTTGTRIEGCTITGPGSAEIAAMNNFGAGIVIADDANNWAVLNCEISEYAQGITTGDCSNVRVSNTHIHTIVGQHGMYFASLSNAVLSGNLIDDVNNQGIKVQLNTGRPDAEDIAITGNTIVNCKSHPILLTNSDASAERARNVTITGNTLSSVGTGNGIHLTHVDGAIVASNTIHDFSAGISVNSSDNISIIGNRIKDGGHQGILLNIVNQAIVAHNTVDNVATANSGSTEFGLHVTGACTDVTITGNKVRDALGNMRYAYYLAPTSQASFSVIGNFGSGATDYGIRTAAAAIREFRNNDVSGTLGRILNAPTEGLGAIARQSFGTAAPVSGTHARGDIVWNTAPAASGTVGWICTTAGSPGTWKTWGAISA